MSKKIKTILAILILILFGIYVISYYMNVRLNYIKEERISEENKPDPFRSIFKSTSLDK